MKKNEKKRLISCSICNFNKAGNLLKLNCGNLDDSPLYQILKIQACKKCGHIYNFLSSADKKGLVKYYNQEYTPLNLGSTDKLGDRPGSANPLTLKRHSQLYNLISPYIDKHSRVLDIGCAMGGFLDYLHKQGLRKLYGIDIVENYVNKAEKKKNYQIKLGSAESIPFGKNSFDLLIMDQVMEHLIEPAKAFKEAKRVLTNNGLFCIGVPDASKYDEIYFFDFYWFLMREHLQHFDVQHLQLLGASQGFELVKFNQTQTPMVNETMILPNLNIVFRLKNKTNNLKITTTHFDLRTIIKKYVKNNLTKLKQKQKIIKKLIASQQPLYVWGIGREFLYLYQSAGLKNCNIVGLIDTNPYKQKSFSVAGKKISHESILKKAKPNSAIIISAIAHQLAIKKTLNKIDYRGQIIEI